MHECSRMYFCIANTTFYNYIAELEYITHNSFNSICLTTLIVKVIEKHKLFMQIINMPCKLIQIKKNKKNKGLVECFNLSYSLIW